MFFAKSTGQRAQGTGLRAQGTGLRAKGEEQRAKSEGQRAKGKKRLVGYFKDLRKFVIFLLNRIRSL